MFDENVIKILFINTDDKIRIINIEKKNQHSSKALINIEVLQKHRVYNRSNFRHKGYYYVDTIKPPYNKRRHRVNYKLHATMDEITSNLH